MLMIVCSGIGIEENRFGPVIGIFVIVGLYPKDPALLSGPAPIRGDIYRLACPEDITGNVVLRGGQVEIHGYRGIDSFHVSQFPISSRNGFQLLFLIFLGT